MFNRVVTFKNLTFYAVVSVWVLALTAVGSVAQGSAQVPAEIRVRVVNATDGAPVPNARVIVVGSAHREITDQSGSAVLRGVPEGRWEVRVSGIGFLLASRNVEAINGQSALSIFRLQPSPLRLDDVTVSGQGVEMIDGAQILIVDDAGPDVQDLADLLHRAVGVTVTRRGGPGAPVTVALRGANASQVLVMLDGIALNSALSGEADLSHIALPNLDRVIVLPGAQSQRYGARAMGGVILLHSRQAERPTGSIGLTVASLGHTEISGNGAMTRGAANRVTLDAGGTWSRADGDFQYRVPEVRGGGLARRENASHTTKAGYVGLRWHRAGLTLTNRLNGTHLTRGTPGTIVQPSHTAQQHQQRFDLSSTLAITGDNGGWSSTISGQQHHADFADPTPPFGTPYDERVRAREFRGRIEMWRHLRWFVVSGGIDGRAQFVEATSLPSGLDDQIREAGLWSQLQAAADIGARSRFAVTVGVRADVHDLIDAPVLSPRVSFVGTLRQTQIELAVGNAYSPPGLSDLFFQENVLTRANPELRPERVRPEVSLTATQGFRLGALAGELRVAGFDADIDDMILWFPNAQYVWSPNNFDVHRQGLEASVEVEGWPTRTTRMSSHAMWTRLTYAGSALSGQVVYYPVFQGRSNAATAIGAFDLSVSGQYMGARRTVPGSSLNQLDGYLLVDAGIATNIVLGQVRLRPELAVRNAFDEANTLLVDYPTPGRVWLARLEVAGR